MERLFAVEEEQHNSLEPLTPKAARSLIQRQKEAGKLTLRASVSEGSPPEGVPLYADDETRVRLFPTVKDATEYLKSRKEALSELGWRHTHGTLGRGTLRFTKDTEQTIIALDKVPAKRKG